jgi:hypothetical protein
VDKTLRMAMCAGLVVAVGLQSGCKKDAGSRSASASGRERSAPEPGGGPQDETAGQLTVRRVLDKWTAGSQDAAVRQLVRMSDEPSIVGGDEVLDISEEQFVTMPRAEREAMHPRLIAASSDARALARCAWDQAKEDRQAGRPQEAERKLHAALRLGECLHGPGRTTLLQLTGKAIEKGSLAELADLYHLTGDADKAQEMKDRLSKL